MRTDDSVLRSIDPALRRRAGAAAALARLRAAAAWTCPFEAPKPLLGCGAELKNTFCVAKGRRAWVGHHIGDLKNYETLSSFTEGIEHFQRLFAVEPEVVAHDLHPDYLSTRYALEREGVELVGVQHHHAHLAACLAEHGSEGPAVGAIYDGTGYGPDGTVWGGELLAGGLAGYERARDALPGPASRRRRGDPRALADGVRLAGRRRRRAGARDPAVARETRSTRQLGGGRASWSRAGSTRPRRPASGGCSTRWRRCAESAPRVNYEGQAAAELEGLSDPAEREAVPAAADRGRDESDGDGGHP